MWKALLDIGTELWENLDDVFVSILIIVIGNQIAHLLYKFTKDFLKLGILPAQTIKIVLQACVFVVILLHILGDDVVRSFTGGISIGIGYDLQPYIISIFNGLMIHNDDIIIPGDNKSYGSIISIPSMNLINVKIDSVGLFNTLLINNKNEKILLSNSTLMRSSIIIHNNDSYYKVNKNVSSKPDEDINDEEEGGHNFLVGLELQHKQ